MDSTIRGILGEATPEELEDPLEEPSQEVAAPEELDGGLPFRNSEDSEIEELANLWNTGNKNEVVRRFTEMNNEDSVKLVFAIGRDGALELARMLDQMPPEEDEGGESTEPEEVVPAEAPAKGPMDDFHDMGKVSKMVGYA